MKALVVTLFLAMASWAEQAPPTDTWVATVKQGKELQVKGRFKEAETLLASAVRESEGPDFSISMAAEALSALGSVYQDEARYTDAEGLFARALELRRSHSPNTLSHAIALSNLGNCYVLEENYGRALPVFAEAAEIFKQPALQGRPELAIVLFSTAQVYEDTNQNGQAEELYRQSVAAAERASASDRHILPNALAKLGAFLYTTGRLSEAEEQLRRALELAQAAPQQSEIGALENNLGEVYRKEGRYQEAEGLFLQSLRGAQDSQHLKDLASTEFNLARLYAEIGKFSDANEYFRSSEAHFRSLLGPKHPELATVLAVEASYYLRRGYSSKAKGFLDESVQIFEQTHPDSLNLATTQLLLADADFAMGEITKASELCRSGLTIRSRILGPEDPGVLQAEQELGEILRAEGQYSAAESLYLHVIKGFEADTSRRPSLLTALNHYAALLRSMGRHADAKHIEARLKAESRSALMAQRN